MYKDKQLIIGMTAEGDSVCLSPRMGNRHGLIAGATGSGKTITLKVLAESFSRMGVPVFLADVKGDLSGMAAPGTMNENLQKRIDKLGLEELGFTFESFPTDYWDLFGQKGIQLRTTISEMGPLLLARILDLNDLQSDILTVLFKIADDENLLLTDTKDLKALLDYVSKHNKDYESSYGKMSPQSLAAILRAVVALEMAGGDIFFGEPALSLADWITRDPDGKGSIHILDSSSLINNGRLYSTFLLWLLSELFETLPEVGDMDRPKMVFFFDEAHLLFSDAPKALVNKVEQVVKLIRSKGVGIYFITQNPRDIPDGVLSQLGNKIEHSLHAYSPAEQKAVKAAAASFPVNPAFDTYEAIMSLGTGEAVVSFLSEDGIPQQAQRVGILPPQSQMGEIDPSTRENLIRQSILYTKYATPVDPDSAYEFLQRRGFEEEQAREEEARRKEEEREQQRLAREAEKEEQRLAREAEKEEQRLAREAQREEQRRAREAEKEEQRLAREAEREQQRLAREAEREARRRELEAAREARRKEREAAKEAAKADAAKKKAIQSVGNTVAGTVGREVGKQVGGSFGKFGKTLGGNVGASLGRGILSTLFKK